MSYRGRPSKGCETCRSRKVKCDEIKPACSRCSKTGHDCQYRDQADLLFRNQTASAAQRAEESWRKRSKSHQRAHSESSTSNKSPPSDNSSPSSHGHQHSSSGIRAPPNRIVECQTHLALHGLAPAPNLDDRTITPGVQTDLRRLAYERFVYDFVSPESPNRSPDEPSDALWTFIPMLYENAVEGSCIAIVVDAVAYINFAHRCNAPKAEALAEECMGRSITLLSKVIADKKLAATNDALGSVYLMGVYENLTTLQRKGTFIAHQHGANALLQLRSIEQYYEDPVSARLYEVAYAQMLLGNLQAGKCPPLPIRNVVSVQEYLPSLYSSSNVFVIRLIWREAMLHAKWHEMKQCADPPTRRLDLQELLKSALELDSEYQAWETTIPPAWMYTVELNTPETRSTYDSKWQKLVLETRGAPEEIHTYPNLKRCWIWGFYRTSRIFLLRDLLEILNWMFRLPELDPLIVRKDSTHKCSDPSTSQEKPTPTGLDNVSLRIHYSFATVHMVNIIEKSSSAILGSFTVSVPSKSFEDVMGMRGYVCLWPLGIMDAVLRSGLVPDSKVSNPSSCNRRCSPQVSLSQMPTLTPRDVAFNVHTQTAQTAHYSHPAADSQFADYPSLAPTSEVSQHCQSTSSAVPHASSHTSPADIPSSAPTSKNGHIFDSSPPHPFDYPVNFPPLDFNITQPRKIDVAARREWLNRMLYYIGTELGIKKALYVPLTEGFMSTVKPSVDSILGR